MSDVEPGDGPQRRRLPLLLPVLIVGLAGYTIFRLSQLEDHLPYNPGPAYPVTTVLLNNGRPDPEAMRTAFLSKRSVRTTTSGPPVISCWPLAGIERERALRVLAEMREAQPGPLCAALSIAVENGEVFVLEQDVFPADAGPRWRYWTHELFRHNDRRRLLVVPVDLHDYPQAR